MANDFMVSNAVAQDMADALAAAVDAGTAAIIRIYDGTPPADVDTALSSNNELATITCSTTAFAAASDGAPGAVLDLNGTSEDTSAASTGTASFFRFLTQDGGTACLQGTAGTSSADLILNTTAITSGSTVSISSGTVTVPETS